MIDPAVLKTCREAIQKSLGSLDDIPPELANTIANVYYSFYAQATGGSTSFVHDDIKAFIEDTASVLSSYKYAQEFVGGLRKIDRRKQPVLYDFTVEFILDILKYQIDRAHEKSGLRRMIERSFRRNKVREIPNLYALIKR